MRLIEILDSLAPTCVLADGRGRRSPAELMDAAVTDHHNYRLTVMASRTAIHRLRSDGVARKVYDVVSA